MLKPGAHVWCDDEEMTLVELKSLGVAVLERENGEHVTRPTATIRLNQRPLNQRKADIAAIDPERWKEAWNIANQMDVLMAIPDAERTAQDIDRVAKFFGKNRSTIYRWMEKHRANGSVSALLRKSRSDAGSRRLDARIENIIAEQLEKGYLGPNRRSVASVFNDIKEACAALNITPPDVSTVRSRVNALDPKLVTERRYGRKYADERYNPLRGSFPNANYPLAVVQIDHTPMDVIVVDEVWRKPIQRPYRPPLAFCARARQRVGGAPGRFARC